MKSIANRRLRIRKKKDEVELVEFYADQIRRQGYEEGYLAGVNAALAGNDVKSIKPNKSISTKLSTEGQHEATITYRYFLYRVADFIVGLDDIPYLVEITRTTHNRQNSITTIRKVEFSYQPDIVEGNMGLCIRENSRNYFNTIMLMDNVAPYADMPTFIEWFLSSFMAEDSVVLDISERFGMGKDTQSTIT